MAEKVLKTKIALLYKTLAQWEEIKDTYKPLKGEVCICEVPAANDAVVETPAVLFKVGNGEDLFKDLPWTHALAADVHTWAKKATLDWNDLDDTFKAALDAYFRTELDGLRTDLTQEIADRKAADEELDGKLDAEIARAKAEENKKPNIIENGTNGTARLFNEKDGGGAKFEHNDGSEAFVGVNDGGKDGLMAQIYADRLEDGKWVGAKLDVTNDGIYYTVGDKSFAQRAIKDNEIATKKDIADIGKALHFVGVAEKQGTETELEAVERTFPISEMKIGAVALCGVKEFVAIGDLETGKATQWKEIGDETLYATKAELADEIAARKAADEAEATARADKDTEIENKLDVEIQRAKDAEADLDARKVEGTLEGTKGTAIIFNEKDGGGAKFEGKDEFAGKAAYVGVHDNINGKLGTQIYVDKDANNSTIIDVTEDGAYYTKGELKPASERDVEANEIATKGDVAALDAELAAIAKTGNVNDLVQTDGDVLILNCND